MRLIDSAEKSAPPNAPLTLEELREMDGEPVWIYNAYNGWCRCCVIELVTQEDAFFTDGTARRTNAYEDGWLAYRRKPEGGDEMKVTCCCIANVDGNCAAEKCAGPIIGFDVNILSQEQARRFYEIAASVFEREFP